MLQNASFLAIVAVHTAENEPSKVCPDVEVASAGATAVEAPLPAAVRGLCEACGVLVDAPASAAPVRKFSRKLDEISESPV